MDITELKDLLIAAGGGAATTQIAIEIFKKIKSRKVDKADIMGQMDKALEEVYETNVKLRNEILELRRKIAEYQIKEIEHGSK
jgi:hypothetical protein